MDSNIELSSELVEKIGRLLAENIKEYVEQAEQCDIGQIEQQMRQVLQKVGAQSLATSLSTLDESYAQTEPCICGGEAEYISHRPAKTMTVFGWVTYRRAYYLCSACHQGQSPLDKRLGLQPGQISSGLAPLLALLGIQVSFDEASRLAQQLLLVEVSDNSILKETHTMGQQQEKIDAEWQEQSIDQGYLYDPVRRKSPSPARLYGSIDGVLTPIGEEWRELKVGCWYEVEPFPERQWSSRYKTRVGQLETLTAKNITYYCDIAPAGDFTQLVWVTGCQRLADQATEIVFVADGAKWIWNLVEANFPKARQIVDWFHAVEYLTPVATVAFTDPDEADRWRMAMCDKLWNSQIQEVIEACVTLETHPRAGDAAYQAATYYHNNQHRMDYACYRREGYLIGSGTVESGCKQIGTMRLKRSGARWTLAGARKTAKARAAWLSDQWDSLAARRRQLPLAV